MIHTQNGIPDSISFVHDRKPYEIPMAAAVEDKHEIDQLATQFAPLLHVFPDRLEIDWDFYCAAGEEYRAAMRKVLLAAGIFSLLRENNFRVALRKSPLIAAGPKLFGSELYFNESRRHDAVAYVSRAHSICGVSAHELTIVRKRLPGLPPPIPPEKFDPNSQLNAQIVITDKWPPIFA